MAGVQGSELTIAVSNAGGLGSLPCAMLSIDAMRKELTAIRAGTSKPINVNFFCHEDPSRDQVRAARWRQKLQPYYDQLGLDPNEVVASGQRRPFNSEAAEAIAEFQPEVVSFHFGLPKSELVDRVQQWEALWLETRGVDIIVAQGWEAGGHRGIFLSDDLTTQMGTFALLPQIIAAVTVPVVAAGGIADAKGVAAAMKLGAAGVQIGTAYLLCPESTTGRLHRNALKGKSARYTAVTNVITGRPARGIVNRLIRDVGPIDLEAPQFPLAYEAVAPLRAKAESMGSSDFSPMWAGQNVTGCKEIAAAELTRSLAALLN